MSSQLDAGSPDAAPSPSDGAAVHRDAQSESGCADDSDCPTGMVLAMATYSAPCSDRVIACRRAPSSDAIWLSGDFTRGSVDAIVALIARVDRQPLLSIGVHGDVAVAKTGCASACVVNSGWLYRLRRVAKTWAITERSMEVE